MLFNQVCITNMKSSLLKEPKTKLLELIKSKGELSIDEAILHLGLAKTTVRQHLLLLEKQNLIQSKTSRAARGRPQRVYQLTQQASVLFPSQESALLTELLSKLIEGGQQSWVNNFFTDYWNKRTKKFKKRLETKGELSTKATQTALLEFLKDEGFMPEIIKKKDGSITVRECNCPFSETIKVTRLPCQLEAIFLEQTLNARLERTSYIPAGATTCTYTSK